MITLIFDQVAAAMAANRKRIAKAMTQKYIKHGNDGIRIQPCEYHRSVANKTVQTKLWFVKAKYRQAPAKCNSDYCFLASYLINHLAISHFQRPSAVLGITLEEFQRATSQEVKIKDGIRFELLVADHKTGASKPAVFYLEPAEKELINLFIKKFRPNTRSTDKVFINSHSHPYDNGSKIMLRFQARSSQPQKTEVELTCLNPNLNPLPCTSRGHF